jgi:succinoglycan biosynthesis transport protein ExoP
MSQEIQPFTTAPATGDYWTGNSAAGAIAPANGAPGFGGSGGPTKHTPLKRLHRLLRGRYPLAIFLGLVGGSAGAIAGFLSMQPRFQSEGLILINPMITTPNPNDPVVPMVGMFLASQTTIIQSEPVADAALNDPDFRAAYAKAYPGQDLPESAVFLASLDAETLRGAFNIKVTFSDRNPQVAQAGTTAAIRAYMSLYGDVGAAERHQKIDYVSKDLARLTDQFNAHEAELGKLSAQYGPDVSGEQTSAVNTLDGLQKELDDARLAYNQAIDPHGKAQVNDQNREFVIQQVASIDQPMRDLLTQRQQLTDALQMAHMTYGTAHPAFQTAQQRLAQKNQEVENYLNNFLMTNPGRVPFVMANGGPNGNLQAIELRVQQLQSELDQQQAKVASLATLHSNIARVESEIGQDQEKIRADNDQLRLYEATNQLTKNVSVISYGRDAELAGNRRPMAAGLGLVLGASIPLGLLMLYGMTENRFRYSDDASDADLQGVTLLGILPNLPDRLSDPQQAGIAAHCVHQIRTMLQINRTNDEPQVLAVTSAAPGDGKTSLTLALGLSYAACGARTLLVDCDLVAAGLSHRLNVSSPEGVLEAVANRALLEYVRTTDIADVAILPVGATHAHHASTLSPVALRRLLSEAKKHFDIILIDTGPILGSIEASLVCAAADHTILAVARGQQRPLVERSIGHLQAIGSRLAGVVFNRAQPRDFERSMSGLALRSRPIQGSTTAGTGNGAAVASSFRRS